MKGRKGPSALALDKTNSYHGNKRKQPFYPVSQISKSSKLRFTWTVKPHSASLCVPS